MVMSWGGYILVLNVIAAHAALLVLGGRYSSNLHRAYSVWFVVGTAGAVQIPIVGWQPFQSLEQLLALAVFAGMQARPPPYTSPAVLRPNQTGGG